MDLIFLCICAKAYIILPKLLVNVSIKIKVQTNLLIYIYASFNIHQEINLTFFPQSNYSISSTNYAMYNFQ